MTYVKNNSYRDLVFCPDTPYVSIYGILESQHDFYIYSNISDLAEKCELQQEEITKCRTVGILQSLNGRFFLSDISTHSERGLKPLVQVSVVYLKSPLQSTVIPYPVQVFGSLQWKNRPVIFANMLQVLSVTSAIRLRNALNGVTGTHLARNGPDTNEVIPSCSR